MDSADPSPPATRGCSGHAESFVERILELELSAALKDEVEPLLDLLGPLNDQIDEVDAQRARLATEDTAAHRLLKGRQILWVSGLDVHRRGHQLKL